VGGRLLAGTIGIINKKLYGHIKLKKQQHKKQTKNNGIKNMQKKG